MLQFIDLHHRFGPNIIFEGLYWHIKPDRKIALIGPNGAGKTTLFQFATEKLKPDGGSVVFSKDTKISLFQQIPDFPEEEPVLSVVLSQNLLYSEYEKKKKQIEELFETIQADSKPYEELLHEQAENEEFAHAHDLHNLEIRARKVLFGLGFSDSSLNQPVKNFSPGYHHRIGLAIALLNPHNLLLLDEPTNHLDDASKEWLAEYLLQSKGTFILVSHDPDFLERTSSTIAEISSNSVTEFEGSLIDYLEEKNEIHEKMKARYEKEQSYLKKRTEWIERFRSKATKARQVQSAIKKLEKRERIDAPEAIFWNKKPDYNFNFVSSGKLILKLENADFSYVSGKPIFQKVDLEISLGDKIALVGPNGAGKSTLMRCLLNREKLNAGTLQLGPRVESGYFSQTHSVDLDPELNLLQVITGRYPDIKEQEARSLLGHFSFSGDAIYKIVKTLSGGEKSRLRLAMLVLQPTNLLLLDEPTNHLDMVTRDALKRSIADFPGAVLIISHDPDFLKGLCNKTFRLSSGSLENLNCSFEDYLQVYEEEKKGEVKAIKATKEKVDGRSSQNPDKKKQRKLEKDILTAEERIDTLEKEKSLLENDMADPDFYSSSQRDTILKRYEEIKPEIEKVISDWEALQLELEELKL